MRNKICLVFVLSIIAFPAMADSYTDFKAQLLDKTGLSYAVQLTTMPQYGENNAWQNMYHASVDWQATHNLALHVAHTGVKYFGKSAADVSDTMGVALPINDYPQTSRVFDKLFATYSGKYLSLSVGQFPMYDFDGGRYDSNQQLNFNNYAFSQNASQAYPTSGLGAFFTIDYDPRLSFSFGAQDATNITGEKITFSGFDQHRVTGFAYGHYKTENSMYRLLVYYQPRVDIQPQASWGWSLNARHTFDQLAVFGRINGTNNSLENVRQSYMIGTVYKNPFDRNTLDQVGIAYALNKLNTNLTQRNYENVFEIYYDFGITDYFVLTPDLQFFINPGDDITKDFATAISLRLTALF